MNTVVFFDTSVLLAGLIDLGESSKYPMRILDAVADGKLPKISTAWHCCLEFYSVATRMPEEYRLEPTDALRLVEQELFGRFEVHSLAGPKLLPFFREACADRIFGGRIYDVHIGAVALEAKAKTVVTDNRRHFDRLRRHGVRILNASEFAELLG